MQELSSTYEALQQSRLACEERDYLIATHERSEAALASHAGSLTSELQQAANNMASLFDRQALHSLMDKVDDSATWQAIFIGQARPPPSRLFPRA